MTTQTKIILDVDTGIDDAWAILYAMRSPGLSVQGITTCFGNADLDTTTRNTLAVVEVAGVPPVPVYRGAHRPLLRPWSGPVPAFHGMNGLGDIDVTEPSLEVESSGAVPFMIDAIEKSPGDIVIVTVARMTNLATCLLARPDLSKKIRRVVTMGGAAFVPGNVTAKAEANIWGDPEAAQIVFSSGVPLTMVGLDVTLKARLTRDDVAQLRPDLPYRKLLTGSTNFYLQAYRDNDPRIDGWCPIHDPLAVAVAEDATLCLLESYPVTVETRGYETDGMTVVDARSGPGSGPISVAVDLDVARFMDGFRRRLGVGPG